MVIIKKVCCDQRTLCPVTLALATDSSAFLSLRQKQIQQALKRALPLIWIGLQRNHLCPVCLA